MTTTLTSLFTGELGVKPRRAALHTTDSYSTLVQPNYLLTCMNGATSLSQGDFVFAAIEDGVSYGIFNVEVDEGVYTLVPYYIVPHSIVNADIALDAEIDFSKMAPILSGNILVGNDDDVLTAMPMTGDTTISDTGLVTIANNAITTAKIVDNAVTVNELADNAVTTNKIVDANVTAAKLAPGITPAYVVKYAGVYNYAGGSNDFFIPVPGMLATDISIVTANTVSVPVARIYEAFAIDDNIGVHMTQDPGSSYLYYVIYRATA
jgi:hypothetical protein